MLNILLTKWRNKEPVSRASWIAFQRLYGVLLLFFLVWMYSPVFFKRFSGYDFFINPTLAAKFVLYILAILVLMYIFGKANWALGVSVLGLAVVLKFSSFLSLIPLFFLGIGILCVFGEHFLWLSKRIIWGVVMAGSLSKFLGWFSGSMALGVLIQGNVLGFRDLSVVSQERVAQWVVVLWPLCELIYFVLLWKKQWVQRCFWCLVIAYFLSQYLFFLYLKQGVWWVFFLSGFNALLLTLFLKPNWPTHCIQNMVALLLSVQSRVQHNFDLGPQKRSFKTWVSYGFSVCVGLGVAWALLSSVDLRRNIFPLPKRQTFVYFWVYSPVYKSGRGYFPSEIAPVFTKSSYLPEEVFAMIEVLNKDLEKDRLPYKLYVDYFGAYQPSSFKRLFPSDFELRHCDEETFKALVKDL